MDIPLRIDRHSGTPVYRQMVEQIRFLVASGVLGKGEELPSTRTFAALHGLNPMTVSKAYAELERDGVLERRPGRPHIVAARDGLSAARDRDQELARALAPAVSAARQLGIEPAHAAELFASLLKHLLDDPHRERT